MRNTLLIPVLVQLLAMLTLSCAQNQPGNATQQQDLIESMQDTINSIQGVLNQLEASDPAPSSMAPLVGAPEKQFDFNGFVAFVGSNLDNYWNERFQNTGISYRAPQLVVWPDNSPIPYTSQGQSHLKEPSEGPFYLAETETIYMPLSELWLQDTERHGDFAVAYIVAHEYGHHIQKLSGIWQQYAAALITTSAQVEHNYLSQRLELQADCLAGTWANSVYYQGLLEAGDVEEALVLAMAIGDDALGKTDSTTWDHGSSEYRQGWFQKGYDTGNPSQCNTWTTSTSDGTSSTHQPEPQTVVVGHYQLTVPQGSSAQQLENGIVQLQTAQSGITITAQVGSQTNLAPSLDQLFSVMNAWSQGQPMQELGDYQTITGYDGLNLTGGQWYEQVYQGSAIHGLFVLDINKSGQGLIVDVFSSGPAQGAQDWQPISDYSSSILGNLRPY